MVLEAPAARRRSEDGDAADCWADWDEDRRQGEKRTRQMGDGGEDSSRVGGWIRWRVL